MPAKKWNEDSLAAEAAKYQTRNEFSKGSAGAYVTARKRGLLDRVCDHMESGRGYWTDDAVVAEALKYKTRVEFSKCSSGAYQYAQKRGLLDQICANMTPIFTYWTEESLTLEALKYQTRKEFQKGSASAYRASLDRGLLDKVCGHMEMVYTYWNEENLIFEATKYGTRNEFEKGSGGAYHAANRLGLLNQICSHMERGANGFQPDKPAHLYIIKLESITQTYIGFGITGNIDSRMRDHKAAATREGFTLTLLETIGFQKGREAATLEAKLKQGLPTVDTGVDGFRTEAILASDKYLLEEIIIQSV